MILYDGSFGRVSYALSIAMVASAGGMDVHILFAHGALKRLIKDHAEDMGDETDREIKEGIERGLAKGSIQSISQQLKDAKKVGLKVYACVNAMAILNVSRDELIGEVDKTMGLSTFLSLAENASITLFI